MRILSYSFTALASILSISACGAGSATSTSDTDGGIAIVAPTPTPTPTASPTPTPAPTITIEAAGGYVPSPTLDGAEPMQAGFSIDLGLVNETIPGDYDPERGAFRFICGGQGTLRYDDPVIFPKQSGRAHLHQPWGNSDFTAFTTPDSLRMNAATDCNKTPYSLNRSLYWMPALINDKDEAIQPDWVAVYYKQYTAASQFCTPGSKRFVGKCIGLPNKIRFIFGWNSNAPTAKVKGAAWVCGGASAYNLEDLFATGKCVAGEQLIAQTQAPECWDGKYLDTPDHRSHMSFGVQDGYGVYSCPATHPYAIPQEENKASWVVTADMYTTSANGVIRPRIFLSSDAMLPGGKAGETLHADYMEGWVGEAKKIWYDNCIEKHLNCSGGTMGNGKRLVGADKPAYGWTNPTPRVRLSSVTK